ncbi:MAG: hypothetical protein WCK90_05965 [archaeon]
MANKDCPKCHGTGVVKEKDGVIHTCWDCLSDGQYDQHSKNVKDSGIKI